MLWYVHFLILSVATFLLLFTPMSITPLIDTEDACFDLNASRPIAKGDLKWRDALLVAHRVNSNTFFKEEMEALNKPPCS